MSHVTHPVFRLMALLVLVLVQISAKDVFHRSGEELKLIPPNIGKLNSIQWKFGLDLLADWYGDDINYYEALVNRTTLDLETGQITIKNGTKNDNGLYSVELNRQVALYDVKFIKNVTKPVIIVKPLNCSPESKNCTLSCDADTADAQPVTYWWKVRGEDWKKGEQLKPIFKEELQDITTFSCRLENPLGSGEESNPMSNPFLHPPVESGIPPAGVAPLVIGLILVILLTVGCFMYKKYPALFSTLKCRVKGNAAAGAGDAERGADDARQRPNGAQRCADAKLVPESAVGLLSNGVASYHTGQPAPTTTPPGEDTPQQDGPPQQR